MDSSVNDVVAAYKADQRPGREAGTVGNGQPWLMLNMVSSIDGAIEIDGVSGALGNDADYAVFKALRGLSDVVLVASGTANAEHYKVPEVDASTAAEREARGQRRLPLVAVVSARLSLDTASPLLGQPGYRPVIVTAETAPADKREALAQSADILVAGTDSVDLGSAVRQLSQLVGPVILAEGGPTLNAALAEADLLDELTLTISPMLVGGPSPRMLGTKPRFPPRDFSVDRAMSAGGMLFTRYLRNREDR